MGAPALHRAEIPRPLPRIRVDRSCVPRRRLPGCDLRDMKIAGDLRTDGPTLDCCRPRWCGRRGVLADGLERPRGCRSGCFAFVTVGHGCGAGRCGPQRAGSMWQRRVESKPSRFAMVGAALLALQTGDPVKGDCSTACAMFAEWVAGRCGWWLSGCDRSVAWDALGGVLGVSGRPGRISCL